MKRNGLSTRARVEMEYLTGGRPNNELTFAETVTDLAETTVDTLMTVRGVTVALAIAIRQATAPAPEAAAQEAYVPATEIE